MAARILLVLLCLIGVALPSTAMADGTESVVGNVIRPAQEEAKAKGCKIAATGSYDITVGDLIELDYSYPIFPDAIPKKMEHKQSSSGAISKSPLGFRTVLTPKLLGGGTVAFYFEAKKAGEEAVTLIIDGAEYKYNFKVAEK
jgi:hypothetical protein